MYLREKQFALFVLWTALGIASPQSQGRENKTLQVQPVSFGLFQPQRFDDSITINAAFTPNGKTVYFSKSHAGWAGLTIFESHLEGQQWSDPAVASFSGTFRDTDPAITPDGETLIFASMRDIHGQPSKTYSLFKASLADGRHRSVEPLGTAINDGSSILYPSIANDGSLYFIRNVGKTVRVFRAEFTDGGYSSPELLVLPGDIDAVFDSDPTIAPDQSFIVFSSNRPDSLGGNDLYISFHRGQQWCKPIHLDAPINSPGPELATGLSTDGRTLYFASSRLSLKQPREKRATAADFRAEVKGYDNGTMRTYQVNLGTWIDSHRPDSASCGTQEPQLN